jgi:DNA-binding protein HU-beta
MTKADLIDLVAKEGNLTKAQASKVVDVMFSGIVNALAKGDKVTVVGFGTFSVSKREERKGRNPQTKAEITIPACKVPKFKAGKKLKEAVNK